MLQDTLRSERADLNIEILGVNRYSANVPEAIEQVSGIAALPWLQDHRDTNVWARWNVVYRDVQILDASNRLVGVYNLTVHDLSAGSNFTELKEMFLKAARPIDANGNRLPDAWEERSLKTLNFTADHDPDGDGYNNFLEFAFGTDPLDPTAHPVLQYSFNASRQFSLAFKRWAGNTVDYLVDVSTNLTQWSRGSAVVRGVTTTLFDGTGRAQARLSLTKNQTNQPAAFVRLNARFKP